MLCLYLYRMLQCVTDCQLPQSTPLYLYPLRYVVQPLGQTVRDCLFTSSSWLTALCLVFQKQRERLASQSSVLSNGEENMYATLNESAKAVSLTFFEY